MGAYLTVTPADRLKDAHASLESVKVGERYSLRSLQFDEDEKRRPRKKRGKKRKVAEAPTTPSPPKLSKRQVSDNDESILEHSPSRACAEHTPRLVSVKPMGNLLLPVVLNVYSRIGKSPKSLIRFPHAFAVASLCLTRSSEARHENEHV